ncbi:endonuclease II [Klebsiella phage ValerieMcCarty02]|nr:endonuclease II [Klebsiella phage ValerieMcCarty02]
MLELYKNLMNLCESSEVAKMSISTMDLEEPLLIKKFNPPWNTQHKVKKC